MIALLILLASSINVVYAGLDDWIMFSHDESHSGESTSTGPETSKVLWSYTTGEPVWSSPAVADGRIYIGSGDDNVYCLDAATGTLIWNNTTGDTAYSSPAVADGRVYIGSDDNKVYCFGSAITMDDILYKIESMETGAASCCEETLEDIGELKTRLNIIEDKIDDC